MPSAQGPGLPLADVATAVGGTLAGDGARRITGLAPLDRAGAGDLTFYASAKYAAEFTATRAGAVLVTPDLAGTAGPCGDRVVVAKPHEAILTLIPRFHRLPERPFAGVHPTAVVAPDAEVAPDACVEAFTVIGPRARVASGAWIGPHGVLGEGVVVGAGSRLHGHVTLYPGAELGARVELHAGVRIGSDGFGYVFRDGAHGKIPHVGRCLIGDDVEVGANSTIDRGSLGATEIGAGTKLDNLVHVGHNVRIGKLCLLMAGVGVAGSVRIGDGVVLAGQVGVSGHVTIGDRATIAAQAGVISDVPAGETWSGYPARPHKRAMRGHAAVAKLPDLMRRLERLLARTEGG
jgi:UDP-3-O-[3-hydroxymyristoyl] glucosamine N-acyltransferase